MQIAIFGRTFNKSCLPYIQQIFDILKAKQVTYYVIEPLHQFLLKNDVQMETIVFEGKDDLPNIDFAFSIGGDGTLLETVTYIESKQTPILAINAGRLGFMATVPIEKISYSLEKFFNKEYTVSERILVQMDTEDKLFGEDNFALNEFAILKRDSSSMIVIQAYINGEFLNTYWADGLIVSTPTGSTGYSLSCGGPLVMPTTNNFIIAPINPHNLNVRPLIVPDNCTLSFKIEGRSKSFLVSLDYRSKKIGANKEIIVSKADFKTKLIEIEDSNYFNVLRNKLNWGLDARN